MESIAGIHAPEPVQVSLLWCLRAFESGALVGSTSAWTPGMRDAHSISIRSAFPGTSHGVVVGYGWAGNTV